MYLRNTGICIILPILVIITVKGNAVNLTDAIHGFHGHNVDPADMMQTMQIMMKMLLNQTAEIEHLKQQTAKIENLNRQSENDRSTIQTLQNRVFFLEAGLNELSKLPSSQEFSTYLSGMNHLTQNSVANEMVVSNLTQRLNDAVAALNDLKLNERSTLQHLLNQSSELEHITQQSEIDRLTIQQLNGSLINVIRDFHDQIASNSSNHAFTASLPSSDDDWTGDTLVFPDLIYSEGKGYNPRTGIFTAPTAGTYVFYVSFLSGHQTSIDLDIILNGASKVRIAAYYNSGHSVLIYQTGTNLAIFHLQTGDRVWVKRHSGVGYFSTGHVITFSGFKLH